MATCGFRVRPAAHPSRPRASSASGRFACSRTRSASLASTGSPASTREHRRISDCPTTPTTSARVGTIPSGADPTVQPYPHRAGHPPLTPRAGSPLHRRALLCAPTVDALRRGRVWASTLRRGRCAVEIALCDAIWSGAFGNTKAAPSWSATPAATGSWRSSPPTPPATPRPSWPRYTHRWPLWRYRHNGHNCRVPGYAELVLDPLMGRDDPAGTRPRDALYVPFGVGRPAHRCRGRTPAPSDPNRRCHSAVGVICAQARGASGDAPPRGPRPARRSSTALRWPSRACFSVAYRIPVTSCSPPMIMVS